MKKLLLLGLISQCLLVSMMSCGPTKQQEEELERKHVNKIIGKSYTTFMGKPMPHGICRFFYKDYMGNPVEFQDSCHLYKMGDVIPN